MPVAHHRGSLLPGMEENIPEVSSKRLSPLLASMSVSRALSNSSSVTLLPHNGPGLGQIRFQEKLVDI